MNHRLDLKAPSWSSAALQRRVDRSVWRRHLGSWTFFDCFSVSLNVLETQNIMSLINPRRLLLNESVTEPQHIQEKEENTPQDSGGLEGKSSHLITLMRQKPFMLHSLLRPWCQIIPSCCPTQFDQWTIATVSSTGHHCTSAGSILSLLRYRIALCSMSSYLQWHGGHVRLFFASTI